LHHVPFDPIPFLADKTDTENRYLSITAHSIKYLNYKSVCNVLVYLQLLFRTVLWVGCLMGQLVCKLYSFRWQDYLLINWNWLKKKRA
jgi:hypothetical protein